MNCELAASITALACTIAQCCSEDELPVLATAFTQLGDTLETIIAVNEACAKKEELKKTSSDCI